MRLLQWIGSGTTRRLGWLLLGLFVASLVVRAAFFVVSVGVDAPLEGDENSYQRIAESFLNGDGWGAGAGDVSYRPPMLSFLLSGSYLVTGSFDTTIGRWTMVLFSSLVAPVLFLVARRVSKCEIWAALLAAIAWVLYPPAIWYASKILTETTAALLVVGALGAFLWTSRSDRRVLPAALTGCLWALSALNRPTFMLLPLALLGGQLMLSRLGPIDWGFSRAQWTIALVAFVVVMSPWTIRNYVEHGVFMPTTSGLGYVLLMSNGNPAHPAIQAGMYHRDPDLMALRNQVEDEAERDAFSRKLAIEEIRDNWRLMLWPLVNRAKNFWTTRPDPYDPSWTRNDWIMLFVWGPAMAFFLTSSFLRSWRQSWPALVIVLYAFILGLPFWSTPRFRFPVDAIIIFGATVGFVELWHRLIALRRRVFRSAKLMTGLGR